MMNVQKNKKVKGGAKRHTTPTVGPRVTKQELQDLGVDPWVDPVILGKVGGGSARLFHYNREKKIVYEEVHTIGGKEYHLVPNLREMLPQQPWERIVMASPLIYEVMPDFPDAGSPI